MGKNLSFILKIWVYGVGKEMAYYGGFMENISLIVRNVVVKNLTSGTQVDGKMVCNDGEKSLRFDL